jgi:pimeloyl-ACP methyl ester carboxylesterase
VDSRLGGVVADIKVEGGTVRAEMVGVGAPLLLLHGWTLDRRIWLPQVQALSASFRVVAIDRRGFGESDAAPGLADEPNDLIAIADALDLGRFAIVGMSQGARVALAFAARYPSRLSGLVVQGAPLSGVPGDEDDLAIDPMIVLAAGGELPRLRALWRKHPLVQVRGTAANQIVDAIVADYAARDLAAPATPLHVTEADLARISAPTLVITGAQEPRWRHRVAAVIAGALGADRVDIPEAGHLANLDQPDTYNQALAGFLKKTEQLRQASIPTDMIEARRL